MFQILRGESPLLGAAIGTHCCASTKATAGGGNKDRTLTILEKHQICKKRKESEFATMKLEDFAEFFPRMLHYKHLARVSAPSECWNWIAERSGGFVKKSVIQYSQLILYEKPLVRTPRILVQCSISKISLISGLNYVETKRYGWRCPA